MKSNKPGPMPAFDEIDPSQCVNAKLRKLHRLINQAYQQKINPFGLRGSMLSIMFIIGKKVEIDQKSLTNMLVLDQSTISRDLKRLANHGLISSRIGEDARQRLFCLTVKGGGLLEEITPVWHALHQKVEHILGAFQLTQIDVLIRSIEDNLEDLRS